MSGAKVTGANLAAYLATGSASNQRAESKVNGRAAFGPRGRVARSGNVDVTTISY
jgi:hypothetical protein